MNMILTIFLLTISLNLSNAQSRQRANVTLNSTVRSIDQPDHMQSSKSQNDKRYIKQIQIHNQIGLDGKVRRIHSNSHKEDKPYGLSKKHLQDNGIIERLHLEADRIDDVSRNSRLVEAYGIPKNKMETNGFIERLSLTSINNQPAKLETENKNVRMRRSIYTGFENEVDEKIVASEAKDMEAQDTKVFRPLFVYRQQVAARERRKHARNIAHKNHWNATRQPCYHRQMTY